MGVWAALCDVEAPDGGAGHDVDADAGRAEAWTGGAGGRRTWCGVGVLWRGEAAAILAGDNEGGWRAGLYAGAGGRRTDGKGRVGVEGEGGVECGGGELSGRGGGDGGGAGVGGDVIVVVAVVVTEVDVRAWGRGGCA